MERSSKISRSVSEVTAHLVSSCTLALFVRLERTGPRFFSLLKLNIKLLAIFQK